MIKIYLLSLFSCTTIKPILNTEKLTITLTKEQCGSYEVKNNGELMGYVVKPFVIEVEKKEDYITWFENIIKTDYSNYYNKFYRTYWFIKDNAQDTILQVVMLSPKQLKFIPDWQCEEQDVDTYKRNRKNLFSIKHPQFLTFNCSKNRFKKAGDPD
ncbi:MAG: hypothetical protein IPJ81_07820 [Chitinophagaceae bacterium]|nr:hypothetical protein [Chitinophagaceae bacterium]